MRVRFLTVAVLLLLLAGRAEAFERGEAYFATDTDFWLAREDWPFTLVTGGCILIDACPAYGGNFFAPAPDRIIFQADGTVYGWDGVVRDFQLPVSWYPIFNHDANLSEFAYGRAGRYLVAERWSTPERGAKLIEFDTRGITAEIRFPDLISGDRALGAEHIELLSDQCTLLYTLGAGDPAGPRVRRMNICTGLPLSDFAILPGPHAGAVRQLPDGDVLVADGNAIRRFTSSGELTLLPYPMPGVTHIALSPDALSFWAGGRNADDAELREFNTASTGSRIVTLCNPGCGRPYKATRVVHLTVVSEWRAAAGHRTRIVGRR